MVTNTGDQKISAVPGRVGIYDLCQKVPHWQSALFHNCQLCIGQIKASTSPLGIWHLCCPRGWGIWTTALISCDMSRCFTRGWWTLEWFQREKLWLHGQMVAKQQSTQALCHVRRYLNSFLWFMLWIYEYVLSWVTIKYSTGDLLLATCNVY